MRQMITTKNKIVREIVDNGENIRSFEIRRQQEIRKNWQELREKGFGYAPKGLPLMMFDYEKGRMLYDVMPDDAWKNQRCFIIGGGESLRDFDFSLLKNEYVIGINRAFEKIDCTINFAMDRDLYEWIIKGKLGKNIRKRFEDFDGFKVWLDTVGYDYPTGIFILNKSGNMNLSHRMKDGISGGTNSGLGALNLAFCLGANPIYLLGFDLKGKNGKQVWWHNGYPRAQSDKVYKAFIKDFERIAPQFKKNDIKVVNLNPESELKCFEFGRFKDIKRIKRPIITSFYTKATGYEQQVKHLKMTLKRFNLENDIEGIDDLGNWHKNTYYKVHFIKRMLDKHIGRPIVFVDADAKIRNNPVLFNDMDCDFACHFRHGKELLSGTLYFNNTDGARYLIEKWLEEDKKYPTTHMPQKNLRAVFDRYQNDIKWKALPVEYCMIFDTRIRRRKNPVIEHFQLSRKYKTKNKSKKRELMNTSLIEIKKFCKNKNLVLIGNADSVLRKEKKIDDFDIVCRMNRGTPRGKECYLGTRTDVHFLSTGMSHKNIIAMFNPVFVVWMTVCNRLAHKWTVENAIQNPKQDWFDLYKKLGINPTTGMMSLNFLLNHIQFKTLTIYGFDFFKTKTWYNTKIDSGQKHSGAKEETLFMNMIKNRPNVKFISAGAKE